MKRNHVVLFSLLFCLMLCLSSMAAATPLNAITALAANAIAGGPITDREEAPRPLRIPTSVALDSVSYVGIDDLIGVNAFTGEAVFIHKDNSLSPIGVRCERPTFVGNHGGGTLYGFKGGRLYAWILRPDANWDLRVINPAGEPICAKLIKAPARIAVNEQGTLLAIGGKGCLTIVNPTTRQSCDAIGIPNGAVVKSATFVGTTIFATIAALDENDEVTCRLYRVTQHRRKYQAECLGYPANEVAYGAERLFTTDRAGIVSWVFTDDGALVPEPLRIRQDSEYRLIGGDPLWNYAMRCDSITGYGVPGR